MADQDNSPDAFARAMNERRRDPAKKERAIPEDFACRPLGVIFVLAGLLLFFFYTYSPISDALAHAASITYKGKWVFIQPLLLLLGIIYTIFGAGASKVLGPSTKPSAWGWVVFAIGIALCFTYMHFVAAYLHGLGYQV